MKIVNVLLYQITVTMKINADVGLTRLVIILVILLTALMDDVCLVLIIVIVCKIRTDNFVSILNNMI